MHKNNLSTLSINSESPYWDPILQPYVEYIIPAQFIEFLNSEKKQKRKQKQDQQQKQQPDDTELLNIYAIYELYTKSRTLLIKIVHAITDALTKEPYPVTIDTTDIDDIFIIENYPYIFPNDEQTKRLCKILLEKIVEMDSMANELISMTNDLVPITISEFNNEIDKLFNKL